MLDSQDQAMADPAYRELIARDLLSQAMIPTVKGFVPPDTPNAVQEIPQWMRETSMFGYHPAAPTGTGIGRAKQYTTSDVGGVAQPSDRAGREGTFSVMGGPQANTLGDLQKVGALIKDLPAAFQNLVLQRITGMSALENDLAKQKDLAKFKHELEAPDRAAKLATSRAEALSRIEGRSAEQQYKEQMLELQREKMMDKRIQVMHLFRQIVDSDNFTEPQKALANSLLQQGLQSFLAPPNGEAAQAGTMPTPSAPSPAPAPAPSVTPPPPPATRLAGELQTARGTVRWRKKAE